MKTIELNLYSFEELSKEIQKKVIENNRDINVSFGWWDSTYEDAKNIGLQLTSFDLDRNRHAKGEFIDTPEMVISKILVDHGPSCETYKTALKYKKAFDEFAGMSEENAVSDDYEDTKHEFLQEILEDYSIILQKECEYLQSDKAIIETIKANEYTFEENGTMRNN